MKKIKTLSTTLLLTAFLVNIYAQDWPQFLGPNRNSTSPQKGILRSWPAKGPDVLWTAGVGPGYGGPVVKNGKVYLPDMDDKTGNVMRCFDLIRERNYGYPAIMLPGLLCFQAQGASLP